MKKQELISQTLQDILNSMDTTGSMPVSSLPAIPSASKKTAGSTITTD